MRFHAEPFAAHLLPFMVLGSIRPVCQRPVGHVRGSVAPATCDSLGNVMRRPAIAR